MSYPVRSSTLPAERDARLRALLAPGALAERLGQAWPGLPWASAELLSAEVERVYDRDGAYALDIVLALRERHGTRRVAWLGEVVDGDVVAYAERVRARLAADRPEQLADDDGMAVVALGDPGLLLRRPGVDRRIPALDLLHEPGRARGLAVDPGDADVAVPTVSLLSHRLEKRAVLRVTAGRRSVIVKAYKRRSPLPADTTRWAGLLPGLGPPVVAGIPDRFAVLWEDLGHGGLDEWSVPADAEIAAAGEILAELHRRATFPLPAHGPRDEAEIVLRAAALAAVARPALAEQLARAAERAVAGLEALAAVDPALVHRDAHPGQVRVVGGRVLMVDFDTLSLGDPVIDLGNYAAHLALGGAGDRVPGFLDACGASGESRARLPAWQMAATVRLLCIGMLSTSRFAGAARGLAGVAE